MILNQQTHTNQLRIAMVVTGFPCSDQPYAGIFNLRAAKALNRMADVTVVHLRAWKPGRHRVESSDFEGIRLIKVAVPQLPGSRNGNIALYRCLGWPRVHSLLRSCNLVHSVDAAFTGILASSWARRARIHHVTQVIGSDINAILPQRRTSRVIAGWEKHLHGVACNSRALAKAFLALYPEARNVHTVFRGVDLERFHPSGRAAGPLADEAPVRYLFLGGFPAYSDLPNRANTKGGETLLAVWQAAEDKLIAAGASLLIAGPESAADRVARWRAGLQRPDMVHLAGVLQPDMVAAYIRSSDVVLIPSLQEGLPNVAMEASACGRPVFGSDIGGINEVIRDGGTGLLLPAGDLTAWKNALVAYASQVSRLKTMGERARYRMEASFDFRRYPLQMLDLYCVALREPIHMD